jgi:hypothetical protein
MRRNPDFREQHRNQISYYPASVFDYTLLFRFFFAYFNSLVVVSSNLVRYIRNQISYYPTSVFDYTLRLRFSFAYF